MGDTLEPTLDPGHYILTWQNPDSDYESIMGFACDLERMFCWIIEARLQNETIAQNRILRIREQWSFWDGYSCMKGDKSNKILTRTLDGKIIMQMNPRNKPECPKCKVNVLNANDLCYKCHATKLQIIANSQSKMCNLGQHDYCKGTGKLRITNEPCICKCHLIPKPINFKEELKRWLN